MRQNLTRNERRMRRINIAFTVVWAVDIIGLLILWATGH